MDPTTIIATISSVIKIANAAVQVGKDAAPFVKALYETFASGKDVTQEDLDDLEARVDVLSNELQVPLPPED